MKHKTTCLFLLLSSIALNGFAGVEEKVDELLPKLAAAEIGQRYAPQMELQAMALSAARPGAEKERAALAQVLASRATDPAVPQPARVWLVRQLEYVGSGESVPVLSALLKDSDAELKECARRALEKNSAAAAIESLRAALAVGGDPRWQIGLIQSLGERRDAKSVTPLAKALGSPETAFAASRALAKIGNDPALKELWAAFDNKLSVATDALLDAAGLMQARGEAKGAAAVYSRLYAGCEGVQHRSAALNGLAKASPEQARKLIPQALAAPDLRFQAAGVSAVREAYGKGVSTALAPMLPNLSASAKICVFRALDSSAEKQVIAAAADPDLEVQLAALTTLGRIGTADSVPVLLQKAVDGPAQAGKAALIALSELSSPGTDEAITKAAAQGEPKARAAAMSTLAERNLRASVPALLNYARETDPAVSAAACSALTKLGTEAELEPFAKLALAGTGRSAATPLQAVVVRVQDKGKAAEQLVALLPGCQPQQTVVLLDALTVLGGQQALAAIAQCVGNPNEEVDNAAVHALAAWPDFSATKPLLTVASAPTATRAHNVIAIQGVARLVKAADKEPADARLDAALAAMKVAGRDEDKKLLLSAFASVPSPRAAEAIKPFLAEPQLKPEAALAALSLGESLLKTDKPTAKSLAEAVKEANISAELSAKAEALLQK